MEAVTEPRLGGGTSDIFGRHELHQQIFRLRRLLETGVEHMPTARIDTLVGPAPDCTQCHGFDERPERSLYVQITPEGLRSLCHEAYDEGVIRGAGKLVDGSNSAYDRWWSNRTTSLRNKTTEDWSASAFGLGLPDAKPTGLPGAVYRKIPPAVHLGRRSEVVEDEVAWCTEMASDHTTRILNKVTCVSCAELWRHHANELIDSEPQREAALRQKLMGEAPLITREELNAALEEQLAEDMESDRECLDEQMEGM